MALQNLTRMLPSRLGCPLSLKTPNMGNTGIYSARARPLFVYIQYIQNRACRKECIQLSADCPF